MLSLPLSSVDLFLGQALPVQTAIQVDAFRWKTQGTAATATVIA